MNTTNTKTKMIRPHELAVIVSSLLTNPEGVGELEEKEVFRAFFERVAEAVADACGGEVGAAQLDDIDPESIDPPSEWMVSVYPNEALPSLGDNIWSRFDPDAVWDDADTDAPSKRVYASVIEGSQRPNDMYLLRWEIDVSADSARDAAEKAFAIQRDPTRAPGVFDVIGSDGSVERIDLAEDDDELSPSASKQPKMG